MNAELSASYLRLVPMCSLAGPRTTWCSWREATSEWGGGERVDMVAGGSNPRCTRRVEGSVCVGGVE